MKAGGRGGQCAQYSSNAKMHNSLANIGNLGKLANNASMFAS